MAEQPFASAVRTPVTPQGVTSVNRPRPGDGIADAPDRGDGKHDDRDAVFARERESGRVHHLEMLTDRVVVGQPLEAHRMGSRLGSAE